jgi:hypothetical protein
MGTAVFRVGGSSAGSGLTVNAEIPTGGLLRVGIQDEEGHGVLGFGLEECTPVTEGGLSITVEWKGSDLRELAGRHVRFVFELEAMTLYGFSGDLYREGA